jgi:hypothetical protein
MLEPSTECIWGCGRSNFNQEHIVGKQFAKALDLPYPLAMRWADYWRMEHKLLEVVINDRVCTGCNGKWMKKLDDRVRAFMGPSITEGASVDISSANQLLLARWAIKVALLLMLWVHDECAKHPELLAATQAQEPGRTGEPYVPVDDFLSVYKRQRPPDGVLIWIGGASDEIPEFFSSVSALLRPAEPSPERFGYYAMFALRHLVVYVIAGIQDPNNGLAGFNPATLAPGKLVPIWPRSTDPVHWPPAQNMTAADVGSLTGSDPGFVESEPPPKVEPEGT